MLRQLLAEQNNKKNGGVYCDRYFSKEKYMATEKSLEFKTKNQQGRQSYRGRDEAKDMDEYIRLRNDVMQNDWQADVGRD